VPCACLAVALTNRARCVFRNRPGKTLGLVWREQRECSALIAEVRDDFLALFAPPAYQLRSTTRARRKTRD
jgi:hypothetical protein